MPKVITDLTELANRKLREYMARNNLTNKDSAINKILEELL